MVKPVFIIEGVEKITDTSREQITVPMATFLGLRVTDNYNSIVNGEKVGRPFAIDNRLFLCIADDTQSCLADSGFALRGIELHHPLLWRGETMKKAIEGADSWEGVKVTSVVEAILIRAIIFIEYAPHLSCKGIHVMGRNLGHVKS